MLRSQANQRDMFSATLKASSQETEAALQQRRGEMNRAWESIDRRWQGIHQRMTAAGVSLPSDANDGMVRLNVGGLHVNVRRSILDGKQGSSPFSGWTLGGLFEVGWDKPLPADADGRIVLDESPVATKYLIHALLTGPYADRDADFGAHLIAADERRYLPFVSRALGLSDPTESRKSTILASDEQGTSRSALQGWLPGETLELKYRATRDGWTTDAFLGICGDGDHRRTITLFQVGSGGSASIVGGFSSVSWSRASADDVYSSSPGAFVFMLKDGAGSGKRTFQPVKWGVKQGKEAYAVRRGCRYSPSFGGDLTSTLDGSPGHLHTNNTCYSVPKGSAFLKLTGNVISEIEVFQVCPTPAAAPKAGLDDSDAPIVRPVQGEEDLRTFGSLVAGSLMEERMALHDAEIELRRVGDKVSAATKALQAVYGPDIAAGDEDPVVELSVRGARMTTLRSTLQVCPDSALATRFDETKWPANEKDVDEHGRRVIDCSPAVFSKVLDVLRMKKRVAWTGNKGLRTVRVAVKAVDREAFEEFVHMQFPGCESFVMDYVDLLEQSQAPAWSGTKRARSSTAVSSPLD